MTEVDWAKPTDVKWLLKRGASQGIIDAAGRVHRMRQTINEMRAETWETPTWLSSKNAQLGTFYKLLANWYSDREMICDRYDVDYLGEEL